MEQTHILSGLWNGVNKMSLHPTKKSDSDKKWMIPRSKRKTVLEPPDYHLIVTEGTKTEPLYFNGLKAEIEKAENGLYRNRIEVSGQGTSCLKLLEDAERLVKANPGKYDHVWLVFDKDDFPEEAFDNTLFRCQALNRQNPEGIQYHALWSNQCIELWFLLHYDYFHSDIIREEYITKLSEYLVNNGNGKYEKNRTDIYEILRPKLSVALRFSKKLRSFHNVNVPSHNTPGTNINELFEALEAYLE